MIEVPVGVDVLVRGDPDCPNTVFKAVKEDELVSELYCRDIDDLLWPTEFCLLSDVKELGEELGELIGKSW